MKGIVVLMMIAQLTDFGMHKAAEEARIIREEGLERVYLSCYLPTGNHCADGTTPHEGVVSSNREHLGDVCIIYDPEMLTPEIVLECHDIGGNAKLRNGTAIDVFKPTMEEAMAMKKKYGDYVWVKWIDKEELENGEINGASPTLQAE